MEALILIEGGRGSRRVGGRAMLVEGLPELMCMSRWTTRYGEHRQSEGLYVPRRIQALERYLDDRQAEYDDRGDLELIPFIMPPAHTDAVRGVMRFALNVPDIGLWEAGQLANLQSRVA